MDTFEYRVTDGALLSPVVTNSIEVYPVAAIAVPVLNWLGMILGMILLAGTGLARLRL